MSTSKAAEPWHAAFPAPSITAPLMARRRAMQMLSLKGVAAVLIVDVRGIDLEGGMIRGSLNIPAKGFWWNRGILYELAYKADLQWVVFTCGSSNGRGPRCASWFLSYVRDQMGDENMQVMTLEGGINGWVKDGPQYTRLMDGFDEQHWKDFFAEEDATKTCNQQAGTTEQP
ncbi:hypothetical protein AAFC00_001737 [Neodothiora populina]|uniref:Rhodanese domain-containing protein n=1 Tax=Neodothiora populina TaxID=2781224 RepID=A0ABR3PPZ9_9PEZI